MQTALIHLAGLMRLRRADATATRDLLSCVHTLSTIAEGSIASRPPSAQHGLTWIFTCPSSSSTGSASQHSLAANLWACRRSYAAQAATRRRSRDRPEATGPVVDSTAPWPWVDPSRPFVLPVWKDVAKPRPVSLPHAITQVKANVAMSKRSEQPTQLSGRPRKAASDKESVELNIIFSTDPRKSDQIVRGVVVLPHGTGKTVRIAVFARGEALETAKSLGVDVLGDEELVQKIASGEAPVNFDRLIATPEFAKVMAKAGKVLGPKGLMPNPKTGTLTDDIETAVKQMRAGRVEFRVGRDKMLQLAVGKVQFSDHALQENITALVQCLLDLRPAALAGEGVSGYIARMYLKSTRTATVPVDPKSCEELAAAARKAAEPERSAQGGVERGANSA